MHCGSLITQTLGELLAIAQLHVDVLSRDWCLQPLHNLENMLLAACLRPLITSCKDLDPLA